MEVISASGSSGVTEQEKKEKTVNCSVASSSQTKPRTVQINSFKGVHRGPSHFNLKKCPLQVSNPAQKQARLANNNKGFKKAGKLGLDVYYSKGPKNKGPKKPKTVQQWRFHRLISDPLLNEPHRIILENKFDPLSIETDADFPETSHTKPPPPEVRGDSLSEVDNEAEPTITSSDLFVYLYPYRNSQW